MARPYQGILICLLAVSIVVGTLYFLRVDDGLDHSETRVLPTKSDHASTTPLAASHQATTDSHSTELQQPPGASHTSPAEPTKTSKPLSDSYSESQGYGPPDRDVDVTALYLIQPAILGNETYLTIKHMFNDHTRFDLESFGGIHYFPMMNPMSAPFYSHPILPSIIPLDPLLFDEVDGMIPLPGTLREPFSTNGTVWK